MLWQPRRNLDTKPFLIAELSGEGDLHDPTFSAFSRTVTLEGTDLSGISQRHYRLSLYPTEDFFDVYSTENPMIATVGAVIIVLLTSLLFFVYDCAVRREFNAKQDLLRAKRKFMRFVSHEVRTPLNAVCMGLTLLREDVGESLAQDRPREATIEETKVVMDHDTISRSNLQAWLTQLEEVHDSAKSSVDVLNDLLNYDKIESGTLALQLTTFSISTMIGAASSEFRLSAKKKMINFEVDENDTILSRDLQLKVVGDKIRITQVLRNLISNAVKFTPVEGKFFWLTGSRLVFQTSTSLELLSSGNVTIQYSWVRPKATDNPRRDYYVLESGEEVGYDRRGSVRVQVTDTGAGMSKEQACPTGSRGNPV